MIENSQMSAVKGTIRIFLVPKLNEKNEQYNCEDARKRAFELDRFVVSSTEKTFLIVSRKKFPTKMSNFISNFKFLLQSSAWIGSSYTKFHRFIDDD